MDAELLQWINTIAVLVGLYVAWQGVDAWKRQLRGSTDYQLARRYLMSVYKVRESVREARNPFIFLGEKIHAMKEKEVEDEFSKDATRAIFNVRLRKVTEAMINFEVEALEAEVSWGKKAAPHRGNMIRLINRLFATHMVHDDDDSGARSIIYDQGDNDEFSPEMEKVIMGIEGFLRPYLR